VSGLTRSLATPLGALAVLWVCLAERNFWAAGVTAEAGTAGR
jgi:hypothetical protein